MSNLRFYYTRSNVYGWAVYDRSTQTPAWDGCAELLPPVKSDEHGTVTADPCCLTEYSASALCLKLNHLDKLNERKEHNHE